MCRFRYQFLASMLLVLWTAVAIQAQQENAGQSLLDQATKLKLDAKSYEDLEKVANLCEQAIKKGLDKENLQFAKQLLTASLYQRASQLCAPALTTPPNERWPAMRDFAMDDLERLLKHDPRFGDALVLVARLQLLPGGDRKRALDSLNLALEVFAADKEKQGGVYVLRSQLQTDADKRLADLNKALELDPENEQILQLRAFSLIASGKVEEAIHDLRALYDQNPKNAVAAAALAEFLGRAGKHEEAVKIANKLIEQQPKNIRSYQLRARLNVFAEDAAAAIDDLTKALEIDPRSVETLLTRASLHEAQQDFELALEDLKTVEKIQPGAPHTSLLRSMVYQRMEKFDDAALELRRLVRANPKNVQLRMQLGLNYSLGNHHQLAITEFDKIIQSDNKSWIAYYSRADILLNTGKHKQAIADYKVALELKRDSEGLLNNLAWVLATSPVDDLRDGTLAVKLALEACELSEYKKPHIISTLAAAYAESGDFEMAIKWAGKAVELGEGEIQEQLESELKSYQDGKQWRELKEDPEGPPLKKEKPVT